MLPLATILKNKISLVGHEEYAALTHVCIVSNVKFGLG